MQDFAFCRLVPRWLGRVECVLGLCEGDGAVVVTVAIMLVVQMPVDQVVDVIAVGHRRVTAVGAVHVVTFVSATVVALGAGVGVGAADLDAMFVYMIAVGMMQMSVVEVVDMSVVLDGDVAAVGAVDMIVVGVLVAVTHGFVAAKAFVSGASAARDKGTACLVSCNFRAGARWMTNSASLEPVFGPQPRKFRGRPGGGDPRAL